MSRRLVTNLTVDAPCMPAEEVFRLYAHPRQMAWAVAIARILDCDVIFDFSKYLRSVH